MADMRALTTFHRVTAGIALTLTACATALTGCASDSGSNSGGGNPFGGGSSTKFDVDGAMKHLTEAREKHASAAGADAKIHDLITSFRRDGGGEGVQFTAFEGNAVKHRSVEHEWGSNEVRVRDDREALSDKKFPADSSGAASAIPMDGIREALGRVDAECKPEQGMITLNVSFLPGGTPWTQINCATSLADNQPTRLATLSGSQLLTLPREANGDAFAARVKAVANTAKATQAGHAQWNGSGTFFEIPNTQRSISGGSCERVRLTLAPTDDIVAVECQDPLPDIRRAKQRIFMMPLERIANAKAVDAAIRGSKFPEGRLIMMVEPRGDANTGAIASVTFTLVDGFDCASAATETGDPTPCK